MSKQTKSSKRTAPVTCVARMAAANPKNDLSDRMAKAEGALRKALRKTITFTAARKAAGTGVHGTRALLMRLGAKSPERGSYSLR